MAARRTAADGNTVEPAVPWVHKASRRPGRDAKLPCAQPYARVCARCRTKHLPSTRLSSSRLVRLLHLRTLQTIERHRADRPSARRRVDRRVTAESSRKRVDARGTSQRSLKPVLESPVLDYAVCRVPSASVSLGRRLARQVLRRKRDPGGRLFRGKAGPRRERGCARRGERGPTWTDSQGGKKYTTKE